MMNKDFIPDAVPEHIGNKIIVGGKEVESGPNA